MADEGLWRQLVTLLDVLEQVDQCVDLGLIPGVPLAAGGRVGVAGLDQLNANAAGVQPGAALPAAGAGVPGAAVFIDQLIDYRLAITDQVMTADVALGQAEQRAC